MTKFTRKLLFFFLVSNQVTLLQCAELSKESSVAIKMIAAEDLVTSRFPFDEKRSQEFCEMIANIMSRSGEKEGEEDKGKFNSNLQFLQMRTTRTSPSTLPVRFSLDNSTDFTTVDGDSQLSKFSIDSSYSEVTRSKFYSACEGDIKEEYFEGAFTCEGAKTTNALDSDFFTPTVVSESGSENNSDAEEDSDCFEGWSVYRVSMEWIASTFVPYLQSGNQLLSSTSFEILDFVKDIFTREATILNIVISDEETLIVVGDIHGQFDDLIRIFEQNGYPSYTNRFIFNGDIVDRGPSSVECLLTLFLMKICYPNSVLITRGNHESHTCGDGTFKSECYGKSQFPSKFFSACHEVFDVLPLGYIIQEKYFVCHGGLPEQFDVNWIQNARKPLFTPLQEALKMSMLWNDPHDGLGMKESKRGGLTLSFGSDITSTFLTNHGFTLLIRSHEYHKDGHFYSQDGRCLTVFSAPNYCGIGNKGVVMRIKPDLSYTIVQIDVPGMEENMNFSMRLGRSKERSLTLNLEDAEYILSFACGVETGKEDCQVPKTDTDEESGIVSGALSLIPDF